MDTSTPDSERRQSFRINEQVYLQHRVLSRAEYAELQAHGNTDPSCELMANLRNISAQGSNILSLIRKNDPDIAQYLALQDRKIELLGRMLEAQVHGANRKPNMDITLSVDGLDFRHDAPLEPGTTLALKLLCFPSYLCLELYGQVEHAEPTEHEFRIGVAFIDQTEQQRELLIRHMLEQQSAQLRQRHAEEADGD